MKQLKAVVRASFLMDHILRGNENVNGSGNKILCSHKDYIFPFDDINGDDKIETVFASALIEKPLDKIYIDDDYDMDSFGIGGPDQPEYKTPLSKLVEQGLKLKDDCVWYGCFIKLSELKPGEVKAIEIYKNDGVHDPILIEKYNLSKIKTFM